MPELTCLCGVALRGGDRDELVGILRRHTDEVHTDLTISDRDVSDYVDAALRMGPPRPRVETIERLEIQPLTSERLGDFLRFFDYEAFPDNPAWASCYCQFFCVANDERWQHQSAAENRAGACERIPNRQMTGYLAYVNGEPAGWCNAGPRSSYPRLDVETGTDGTAVEATGIGSIVCFVIAPPYRRHGLARRLLEATLDGFRAQGFAIAEGYPNREVENDGAAYRGPPALYTDAGFVPFRELERQTIMRLDLNQAHPAR
jgi:GNAT superfamily N-acetyltransferase